MLVLGLDAGKQLGDERPLAELIAGERGEESILAVERGRHIVAVSEKRAIIVVAAEACDRAKPEARLIQSLAEGGAAAHIDAGIVVARFDPGEDLGVGFDGLRGSYWANRQRIRDAIPPAPLARSQAPTTNPRRPTWRTLAAASDPTMLHVPHADYARLGNRMMCNSIHRNLRWRFGGWSGLVAHYLAGKA